MTHNFPVLGLIPLLPALGVVFILFFGARAGRPTVNLVGPLMVVLAFAASLWSLIELLELPAGSALYVDLWPWIAAGDFHVSIGLHFDALTAIMTLVVSGVGALIHVYCIGYMAEDPDYARFFTYMNLFTFSMLVLVLADNLLLMFVGWEGVGLCSYLLIAFWYENPEFAYNGRKAFIVNRIGDAGFVLGILTIVGALAAHGIWTLRFAEMRAHADLLAPVALAAGLLLFMGATGKSAQIPLYVWLPDAMVGPTPVSALIHAATMVTAGVYMIARLNFLYSLSPEALTVVAVIGGVTSFFAATIAIVQIDIKRVLAYSTISQIGYMILAVGVGSYASGIFHLMTHACFKALLFLCAGAVMHALGGEQNMEKMGGLRRNLPLTWITMLIAALAISGIPPFSGFFSKDEVLEATYASGHLALYLLGLITAFLTAFYIFRLIFLTFHGKSRVAPELAHVHDAPPSMSLPLVVLAILSIGTGWIGLPKNLLWGNALARFLDPVFVAQLTPTVSATPVFTLSAIATVVALAGIALAWVLYIRLPGLPQLAAFRLGALYRTLAHKYYVDEIYNAVISRPLFWLSRVVLFRGIDRGVLDGIADGTGITVADSGEGLRRSETGNVRDYALVYLLGAIAIAAYYVWQVTH